MVATALVLGSALGVCSLVGLGVSCLSLSSEMQPVVQNLLSRPIGYVSLVTSAWCSVLAMLILKGSGGELLWLCRLLGPTNVITSVCMGWRVFARGGTFYHLILCIVHQASAGVCAACWQHIGRQNAAPRAVRDTAAKSTSLPRGQHTMRQVALGPDGGRRCNAHSSRDPRRSACGTGECRIPEQKSEM